MTETKKSIHGNEKYEKDKIELYSLLSLNRDDGPHSFEKAVRKTGFGKFNYALLFFAFCGIFSPLFETTTLSYVFASAQCDLNLSLQDKGYLNSAVFAGMITSSFIWGFLLDTFGRRRLMVFGYFVDATLVFMSAFSQNFTMLIICKFAGGLIINGPFSAMTAYLSEFHSSKYRSRIQLVNGSLTSMAQIILPLLAWGILPLPINWAPLDGKMEFHSWNLFLLITGLCPFISGIIFFFLPESPKYLMTSGENEKAMEVLQMVYSWNTGNPPEDYPVKELIQEIQKGGDDDDFEDEDGAVIDHKSKLHAVNEGLHNLAPLFKSPYLAKFCLIATIEVMFLTSLNMLRLWTPQMFQALEDYKLDNNGTTTDLCTMLEVLKPKSTNGTCIEQNVAQPSVYINSMLVASSAIWCYILAIFLINRLGKKIMIIALAGMGSVACMSLYFSQGALTTTVLTSIFVSCGNVGANIVLAVTVDVFPTSVRAFAVSLVMATARVGITTGNIIFPMLLQAGCAPPFFVVGGAMAVGGLLSLLLPNTENKALQ